MTSLANTSDVSVRLGRTLDANETTRVESILADVSAAVRRFCGQTFTASTTTERLRVSRAVVRLPEWPVNSVTSVVDMNSNAILYNWYDGDVINVSNLDSWANEPWATAPQWVDVTYNHGYSSIPDDLVGIVCQIASRVLGTKPDHTAKSSEQLGDYRYSIGSAAASGPVGLLPSEREALTMWKRPGRPVHMLQ